MDSRARTGVAHSMVRILVTPPQLTVLLALAAHTEAPAWERHRTVEEAIERGRAPIAAICTIITLFTWAIARRWEGFRPVSATKTRTMILQNPPRHRMNKPCESTDGNSCVQITNSAAIVYYLGADNELKGDDDQSCKHRNTEAALPPCAQRQP